MKRYTIHPIIAYIVHLSGMEGTHINELAVIVGRHDTNDINQKNKTE